MADIRCCLLRGGDQEGASGSAVVAEAAIAPRLDRPTGDRVENGHQCGDNWACSLDSFTARHLKMTVTSAKMRADAHSTAASGVTIYTDGACKGNPGPGGWGALLQAGDKTKELFGGERQTTNNRMELMAVIQALEALKRPCQIDLWLDSQYVRQGITEWIHGWKAKGWKTASKQPVKNADLWQRLDALVHGGAHDIRWHWVKGHAGHPGNERADALANQGVAALR